MNSIHKRLKELGLSLPEASTPGGSYVSVNVRNKIAYVAIQFPILNGQYLYQGRLGKEMNTGEGYEAARLAALNVISQINAKVGFDQVLGLNHMDAYYQAEDEWDEAPKVVDGASDLFTSLLADKGTHSRSIFGVDRLPRNFSVGISCTFSLL